MRDWYYLLEQNFCNMHTTDAGEEAIAQSPMGFLTAVFTQAAVANTTEEAQMMFFESQKVLKKMIFTPADLDIAQKKCFTVSILQVLHHKFVLHDRENLPCKVPKGKHS